MNLGEAIKELRDGKCVARGNWLRGDYLLYIHETKMKLNEGNRYYESGMSNVTIAEHIDMIVGWDRICPGWKPSYDDMMANDWRVVEVC